MIKYFIVILQACIYLNYLPFRLLVYFQSQLSAGFPVQFNYIVGSIRMFLMIVIAN